MKNWVRPEKMSGQPAELDFEAPGLIWVKCPHLVVPPGLEAVLKTAGYGFYCGREAPEKDVPSSVIYRPNEEEEDVGSEVRRLRVLSEDAPVVVSCASVDSQLVLTALQAGARGFVGTRPAQIIRALSTASTRSGIVVARELLEALLAERESREDRLAPHQLGIVFELATLAMITGGEIVFSEEFLEAFLVEVVMA